MTLNNNEKIKKIMEKSEQFVVICGPSGSGKTMVAEYLISNYGFAELPFLTTRDLRPGEKEIGACQITRDEFIEQSQGGNIFLGVRSYGNAYGYNLDLIYSQTMNGQRIVVEAPASYLTTDVSYFLPKSTIIGVIPLTPNETERQLEARGLNAAVDQRLRVLNCEIEKEHIAYSCGTIDVTPILPTDGSPEHTLRQVDRLMEKRGFSKV